MSLSPRERIEELEEENRQLRAMLAPPLPWYRGLEKATRAEMCVLASLKLGGLWSAERLQDGFRLRKQDYAAIPKPCKS